MMKHAQAPLSTKMFPWLAALLVVTAGAGCGSLTQRVSSLEDDELYLDRGAEFITDAEYLAYAYEQAHDWASRRPDLDALAKAGTPPGAEGAAAPSEPGGAR